MSRRELVDAYVSGAINRRTFVRGLTAHGLTASMAASYAVALRPAAAEARKGSDFYDDRQGRSGVEDDGKMGQSAMPNYANHGQSIAFVNRRQNT